ncbi:MAG: hypothetical protein EBR59_08230 [Methylococcaceae bacterium]|jgi:predicted nucleotidyltransferase|nr:hypothetical protein [Methylococcaceae bacterium]
MYQVKDFIQTNEGLLFAVVHSALESGRVLVFLRYVWMDSQWCKLHSDEANAYLRLHAPHYLWHSVLLDADLHAVPLFAIHQHYQPRQVLSDLLLTATDDPVLMDLQHLCRLFAEKNIDLKQLGVTGSCLLGLQKHSSDLDLVCYQATQFIRLRQVLEQLITEDRCQSLSDCDWLEAFQRRGCVDLSLDDYIWHEQRKLNKGIINQRKFDLSLVNPSAEECHRYQKLGYVKLQAKVVDDSAGFDYPACFVIDHASIATVVSFTATYSGQAQSGETIIAAGQLEMDEYGRQRLVIGSSREAVGEFIRVCRV